jgi:hypothetical protein
MPLRVVELMIRVRQQRLYCSSAFTGYCRRRAFSVVVLCRLHPWDGYEKFFEYTRGHIFAYLISRGVDYSSISIFSRGGGQLTISCHTVFQVLVVLVLTVPSDLF